jgi:hypothetical protein
MRISLAEKNGIFYEGSGDLGVLEPLFNTYGVVFPYTPTVSVNYSAGYSSQKSTHSNYPAYFYEASEVQEIQLSAPFSVQNVDEGQYLLATIYFFRAVTKMFYGQSPNAGNPPPIVFLDGYGSHYFPHVPCIVTGFTHSMPDDADYIQIPIGAGAVNNIDQVQVGPPEQAVQGGGPDITRLPTLSDIQVRLQPVYSRKSIAGFDLEEFARGRLLDKGFI